MITVNVSESFRKQYVLDLFLKQEPGAEKIKLIVTKWAEYKRDDGTWARVPHTFMPEAYDCTIDQNLFIDPSTLRICARDDEGAVCAYSYFIVASPELLGMTSLADRVYPAISHQVESYMQVNSLLED